MGVYNNNNEETSHEDKGIFADDGAIVGRPLNGTKFNISMEKRIERLWYESKALGWTFNGFVSHLMEILIIIQHRSRVPVQAYPPKRRRLRSHTQ